MDASRVQDTELRGADDEAVLVWATEHQRVVVSHDVNTMPGFAYERLAEGKPMAGLVLVPEELPIGEEIEQLLVVSQCATQEEFEGKVVYLPL